MRVTESRLTSLATASLDQVRQRLVNTQEELSTGMRVSRPSQGAADWARGERARARATQSEARGKAIGVATAQVEETDRALDTIGSLLSEARTIAVQGSNDTLSDSDRDILATSIKNIRQQTLAAVNAVGPTGEHLFSGSQNGAPFDISSGAFIGDNISRDIEVAEGQTQTVNITGDKLTASAGVDILGTLSAIETALNNNDPASLRTLLSSLDKGTEQIGMVRSQLGGQLSALQDADDSRKGFEESLARIVSDAQEIDVISSASELAQGLNALEAAKASTEKLFSFLLQR
jgi:flagellar hook-associated protein 3 FlgL